MRVSPRAGVPAAPGVSREPVQRGGQQVNLAAGVVHGQRRPDCRLQPVTAQDRLGAVVASPDRDALLVQRRADVLRPPSVQDEGQHAGLLRGGADQAETRYGLQFPEGVAEQAVLVAGDGGQAGLADEVERGTEGDRIADAARPRLEPGGRALVGGPLERDVPDHVPATLPGRHRLQQLGLAVEHPDAGGREHLVPGEHVEIRVQAAYIGWQVRDGLGAVDEHPGPGPVRPLDHLADRHDGAEGVGHVRDRDQAGAVAEQIGVGAEEQLALVVYGDDLQRRADLLGELLPGHDVGVMLEVGDQDLVAVPDVLAPPGLGHQVDGLGGAPGVDDGLARWCADEVRDRGPGRLVRVGRPSGQGMRGPVDVGVLVRVEVAEPVDHHLRFLGGGRVVQPDQLPSVDPLAEDRELAAD